MFFHELALVSNSFLSAVVLICTATTTDKVEAYGKKLRPLQVRRKRQLEALGFSVYCVSSTEQIGGVLNEIQSA